MRPRRAYHRTNAPLFGEQPLHHIALWRVRHRHGLDVIHHVLADAAQVDLEPRGGRRRLLVVAFAAAIAAATALCRKQPLHQLSLGRVRHRYGLGVVHLVGRYLAQV